MNRFNANLQKFGILPKKLSIIRENIFYNECNERNECEDEKPDVPIVVNQNSPTFNILIATIGRNSLENLIDSLVPQLLKDDCLTIVFDGNTQRSISNIDQLQCNVVIYNEPSKLGFWGHAIRNKYAPLLERKDFVMHADDDDIYLPNVFDKLRNICKNKKLYIARMKKGNILIPSQPFIFIGNIGTPCGIIPYEYNDKGHWGHYCGGDGNFYMSLEKHITPEFLPLVIYQVG